MVSCQYHSCFFLVCGKSFWNNVLVVIWCIFKSLRRILYQLSIINFNLWHYLFHRFPSITLKKKLKRDSTIFLSFFAPDNNHFISMSYVAVICCVTCSDHLLCNYKMRIALIQLLLLFETKCPDSRNFCNYFAHITLPTFYTSTHIHTQNV